MSAKAKKIRTPWWRLVLGVALTAVAIACVGTVLFEVWLHVDQPDYEFIGGSGLYNPAMWIIGSLCYFLLVDRRVLNTACVMLLTFPAYSSLTNNFLPTAAGDPLDGVHSLVGKLFVLSLQHTLVLLIILMALTLAIRSIPPKVLKQPQFILFAVLIPAGLLFGLTIQHAKHEQAKLDAQYTQQNLNAALHLPFKLYIPSDTGGGKAVGSLSQDPSVSYSVTYYDGINSSFSEYSASAKASFSPPRCDPRAPGEADASPGIDFSQTDCSVIGTSKAGCTVYYIAAALDSDGYSAYYQIGATQIVLETPRNNGLSQAKIIEVFDSLHVASPADIRQINTF